MRISPTTPISRSNPFALGNGWEPTAHEQFGLQIEVWADDLGEYVELLILAVDLMLLTLIAPSTRATSLSSSDHVACCARRRLC